MTKVVLSLFVGFFIAACAYTQGKEVTAAQLEGFVVGKSTKADVEQVVGNPQRKQDLNGGEIWYYDFTKISANPFGGNVDESTVFEFSKKGVLTKKYKSKGSGNANPLLGK